MGVTPNRPWTPEPALFVKFQLQSAGCFERELNGTRETSKISLNSFTFLQTDKETNSCDKVSVISLHTYIIIQLHLAFDVNKTCNHTAIFAPVLFC